MDRMVMTPSEAAEVLGVSRATIYRAIRRSGFPIVYVEGCPRVPVAALNTWLNSKAGELGSSRMVFRRR